MKEIVVISGKGGTGKTSLTASFAYLGGEQLIVADCDVDAADMHLLLAPDFGNAEDFYSGELARIDPDLCIGCGMCRDVCRFGAVMESGELFAVDPLACEGCGYCARICPVDAIENSVQNVGALYTSSIRTGTAMVHARLHIGAENSGKLVARVKRDAKRLAEEQGKQAVLVDGSPGIGCPVVSSLTGASYVVLVTEPTVSGFHDLKRVYELVHTFRIPAGCIVNKADLNKSVAEQIGEFLEEHGIELLARIPYSERFTEAMTNGKTIVEFDRELKEVISASWVRIQGAASLKAD